MDQHENEFSLLPYLQSYAPCSRKHFPRLQDWKYKFCKQLYESACTQASRVGIRTTYLSICDGRVGPHSPWQIVEP